MLLLPAVLARRAFHGGLRVGGAAWPRRLAADAGAKVSSLEMHKYHAVASGTLQCLQEQMEKMVDERDDDSDVDFSGDVLNLTIANHGTFVLNKQAPNKQIWLSSPVSGPQRFDFDLEVLDWVHTRDRSSLATVLSNDISHITGRKEHFEIQEAVFSALR